MKIKWIGVKLLSVVLFIYLVLFIYNSNEIIKAFFIALHIFWKILAVLLTVVILNALIDFYFDMEKISDNFYKNKGIKNWSIALISGVLSMGPLYVWYPILYDFRKKGMPFGYIASFLYAKAVKIPFLPVLISYFGILYSVIFTLYIIIAAWIQGMIIFYICDKYNKCN